MKGIAKFSVERAITVFMAVILVAVFGVVSFTRLTTDLFPSMNIPYAVVITTYPGASPDEVEETVSKPLEATFSTTTNIKEVQSTSQENLSIITLEFNSSTNMDSAMIEMRENLDMIKGSLPDSVSNPMIIKINPDMMPIMSFSVTKEGYTQKDLTEYIDDSLLPQIERIGGVASVSVSGAFESEIHVIIDEVALAAKNAQLSAIIPDFEITKGMISGILTAQNFGFPTGYINLGGSNYLVRVGDKLEDKEAIENLTIFNSIPGMTVKISDIASVDYISAADKEYSKVNGENAITLTIQKSSNFATTDVTKEIFKTLELLSSEEDIEYTILLDQGEYINQSTGSVTDNLLYGGLLALIILFVFLRSFRATFIVGIAIPISLLFAIVLIYLSGITLNIVSLGGLALGIGMLVDNSIVVMENIFRLKKQGYSNKKAAIEGTHQVAGAITASTLTTISVFLPIIFIEGFIKEIFMQMAMTIAFSLSASLMIALTLVPSVASKVLKEETVKESKPTLINKIQKGYEKVFNFAFKIKYVVLALVIVLFGGSIGLALTNGFEYFPASDEGGINVSISVPETVDSEERLSFDDFTTLLDEFGAELRENSNVETVGISLGGGQMMFFGVTDASSATVNIILKDSRTIETSEFEAVVSDILDENYTEVEYEISGTQTMTSAMTGSGIQLQLSGYDLEVLKTEALTLQEILMDIDGVKEVDPGIGKLSQEIKVTVNKDLAIAQGFTVAQVLQKVADEIKVDSKISSITINGNMYDIYVVDSETKDSNTEYELSDIENIILGQNILDEDVLVSDVATVLFDEGFGSISRVNNSRVLTVSVILEDGYNVSLVANEITSTLESDYTVPTGYELTELGENEEIMEAVNVLLLAMALAVVLIYMIMASQFQSLTYPFIIMFTIPLAFTGGFLSLYIFNMPVSVVSLIGLIILTGVVVNNGIVLVDYTNQLRNKGYKIKEALLEAGKTRLRPILMTALTTILALSTMALAVGEGSEMMQPMALTTIGGLIYATVLTLFIVPIMYYLVSFHSKGLLGAIAILITLLVFGYLYYTNPLVMYIIIFAVILVIEILLTIFLPKREVDEVVVIEDKKPTDVDEFLKKVMSK